jgi:4-amino-4-deoxy-L-arabinose transferase-like glycosyltransferase
LTPDRRTILVLFSLTFGLRILYAALAGIDPNLIPNPITHEFLLGRQIAEGANWWSQPLSPLAPGYPLMLGALFAVGGVHRWLVIILQAFFSGAIAFFLFRIGEKTLSRGVGLAAALWFSIYVHQAHFASLVVRDATVGMLVVFVCYQLIRYSHTMRGALWTGLVFTVLVSFDPQYLLFLPLVALFYLVFGGRHPLLRLQHVFLFLATVILLLTPWTIRNYRVYKEPIPVALEAVKYLDPFKAMRPAPVEDAAVGHNNGLSRPGFWRNTVEYWRVVRLTSGARKLANGSTRVVPAWSARHNAVSLVTYGLLLPFLIVGLWISVRAHKRAGMVITVAIAGMYLIRAFYGGSPRARLPAEPLIILLAFQGVVQLYNRYRRPRPAKAGAAEGVGAAPNTPGA